jgi:DNA-binding NarL/FixJ family response regulator
MEQTPFNVLVVDDHTVVRKGLISILEEDRNIFQIFEAGSGAAAREIIIAKNPHVALMDISLPDISGIDVIREMNRLPEIAGTTRFLVLSIFDSPEYYFRAIKAGASGMISKSVPPKELIEGIYKILAGEMFFGFNISKEKISSMMEHFESIDFEKHDPETVYLTRREREVLILAYRGFTTREIADKLCVSERTVDTHRSTLIKKLNMNSFADLNHIVKNSDKLSKLVALYESSTKKN